MTGFTTRTQQTSRIRLPSEFPATTGQVLGAEFGRAMEFNPLPSLWRSAELFTTSGDLQLRPEYEGLSATERRRLGRTEDLYEYLEGTASTPILSQEEATERVRERGFDIEIAPRGISEGTLQLLIDRHERERQRESILSRAPTGLALGAGRLGTQFIASALDPINIASAFIPVGRTASVAQRLASPRASTRFAGRLQQGAIEGAVGAAIVEPFVLSTARQEQADYELSDTLLNIAFGTVLGAGLHGATGVVADRLGLSQYARGARSTTAEAIASVDPATRRDMARAAIAQAVEGRQVDVEAFGGVVPVRFVEQEVRTPGRPAQRITPEISAVAREINPRLMEQIDELESRQRRLRSWVTDLGETRRATVTENPVIQAIDAELVELRRRRVAQGARKKKLTDQRIERLEAERAAVIDERLRRDTPDMATVRRELIDVDRRLRDLATERTAVMAQAREAAEQRAEYIPGIDDELRFVRRYEIDASAEGAEVARQARIAYEADIKRRSDATFDKLRNYLYDEAVAAEIRQRAEAGRPFTVNDAAAEAEAEWQTANNLARSMGVEVAEDADIVRASELAGESDTLFRSVAACVLG